MDRVLCSAVLEQKQCKKLRMGLLRVKSGLKLLQVFRVSGVEEIRGSRTDKIERKVSREIRQKRVSSNSYKDLSLR